MGVKVFEYECPTHGKFEEFSWGRKEWTLCPQCKEVSTPALSAPRSNLEGITGAFPDAAAKWKRLHIEAAKPSKS